MHSCCVTGKTPVQQLGSAPLPRGFGGVTAAEAICYVSSGHKYLVQRPPLQQFGYLPVLLHPLLERHVCRVCALSHLDQVIGENNQHPVSITIPIKKPSASHEANGDTGRTDSSPPCSSISVASRSPFRSSRPSICIFKSIRSKVDGADGVHIRINGLSEVLHVLHQINGPVGQLLRNLPMGEHPHE